MEFAGLNVTEAYKDHTGRLQTLMQIPSTEIQSIFFQACTLVLAIKGLI